MSDAILNSSLRGAPIHLTGIKGTGMAALAELLHKRGVVVTGSDTHEKFYTDEVLTRLGIPYVEEFSAENIHAGLKMVVYSAAYDPLVNPELVKARELGIPIIVYPEALGLLSLGCDSSAVAGVHGKTTTTALIGAILKRLDFPASILAGSAVSSFDGTSTAVLGDEYFIAETCEYRRHFLHFHPRRIILTSVEADHLDYFKGYDDVRNAFLTFCGRLPPDGALIYCADDPGASEVANAVRAQGNRAELVPYGRSAEGRFAIDSVELHPGATSFRLRGMAGRALSLRIPGNHTVLNAAAAVALVSLLFEDKYGHTMSDGELDRVAAGLAEFAGSKRRSEIVGEAGGVLFIDDYGHHPTAIRTTLAGLRAFYPHRRIILDFMSHTYSRTEALIDEFAVCFSDADMVILHKIYASAREKSGTVTGRDLFRRVAENHRAVHYFEEVEDAVPFCEQTLRPGDLFVTMGAGNNWVLGRRLFERRIAAGSPA